MRHSASMSQEPDEIHILLFIIQRCHHLACIDNTTVNDCLGMLNIFIKQTEKIMSSFWIYSK